MKSDDDDQIAMQLGGLKSRGAQEPLDEEGRCFKYNTINTIIIDYNNRSTSYKIR